MKKTKQQQIKDLLEELQQQGYTREEILATLQTPAAEPQQSTNRLHNTSIDITERVKTFTDALAYLGEDNRLVKEYHTTRNAMGDDGADMVAYAQLRIITAALNEEPQGWRPPYDGATPYYWPYFRVVAFGGYAYNGANAGLADADASRGWSYADAYCGSRLCYKTSALAAYSGKTFREIWEKYILR